MENDETSPQPKQLQVPLINGKIGLLLRLQAFACEVERVPILKQDNTSPLLASIHLVYKWVVGLEYLEIRAFVFLYR